MKFCVYPDYVSLIQNRLELNSQIKDFETVPNAKNIMVNQFFQNVKSNIGSKSFEEVVRKSLEMQKQ